MPPNSTAPLTPPARPSRLRRLGCGLLLIVLLIVLAVAWWLLETERGRSLVLDQVDDLLRDTADLSARADDFSLDLRQGELVLRNVVLVAGEPPEPSSPDPLSFDQATAPWLTAERIVVRFELGALRRTPRRLESVRVETALLDLRAPLPGGGGDGADDVRETTGLELPIAVDSVEIVDSRIEGAGLERGWLERWSIETFDAHGALDADAARLDLDGARALLHRRDAEGPLGIDVEAAVHGPILGPYTVDALRADAEGLDLDATGIVGTRDGEPIEADLQLVAEPARLLPEIAAGAGRVEASGRLDLRRLTGRLDVSARDFPPAVLEPFVDPEVLERLAARGTRLDVDATLDLRDPGVDGVYGSARAQWRRGDEVLVEASAETLETPGDDAEALALRFDAALLPANVGVRRVAGRLDAPRWAELGDATLRDTRVELRSDDIGQLLAELRDRWPQLITLPLDPAAADGDALEVDVRLDGVVTAPRVEGTTTWRPDPAGRPGAAATLEASGRPTARSGTAALRLEAFDLELLGPFLPGPVLERPELAGTVDGMLALDGTPDDFRLTAALDAADLAVGSAGDAPSLRLPEVSLRVGTDGRTLRFERLDGRLRLPDSPEQSGESEESTAARIVPFSVDGTVEIAPGAEDVVRGGDLRLAATEPAPGVDSATLRAQLEDGTLRVDLLDFQAADGLPGVARFDAVMPLEALARLPGLDAVRTLPTPRADGPVHLLVDVPHLDSEALLSWLGAAPRPERLRTGLELALRFDPDDPSAGSGSIVLRDPVVELEDARVVADEPLRLELADHRLRLRRSVLTMNDQPFDIEGDVVLAPGWQLDESPAELVQRLQAYGTGNVALSLLDPFLAGGTGSGNADLSLVIAGTLDQIEGELTVASSDGSIQFVEPYATRIAAPRLRMTLDGDVLEIVELEASLNEGELDLEGTIDPDGGTELRGFLDRVRYRVDYGLTAIVSGNFALQLPPEGADAEPLLQANLLVERGYLRTNIDTDREILQLLLAPPEIKVPDEPGSLAQRLRLDIDIATVDGISVKNNVADLKASWAPLSVGGTLAAPRIDGSIEVDPGGRVYAYGQVVRLDEARLEFSGDPQVASRLELETTTSLDDPSIATPEDQRVLASLDRSNWRERGALTEEEQAQRTRDAIAAGLGTYYGGRLASSLTSGLSQTRVSYERLFLFGETDPEARLVITRDLSAQIAVALALNLRNSEDHVYLVEVHDLDILPSLSLRAFTNDENDYGAIVQQSVQLGGGRAPEDDDRPRLEEVEVACTGCRSDKVVRRALPYRTGDRVPFGADFDVEVDVAEAMRRSGYADPTVRADFEPNPAKADEVTLHLEIEAGPFAEFEFSGEMPPKRRRDGITHLYRADFYEQASMTEMRLQTERIWRALGHPEPRVDVRVEPIDARAPEGDRRVVIHSEPGRRLELDSLRIDGVPADVASALGIGIDSLLGRIELATGDEAAQRRLLRDLADLGYPEASLTAFRIDDAEETLVLEVEPGPRQVIAEVTVRGVDETLPDDVRQSLDQQVIVEPGDPARQVLMRGVAVDLERALADAGYRDAAVDLRTEELDDRHLALTYDVAPGRRYRLAELHIDGERDTSRNWIRRTTGLEEGEVLSSEALAEARRNLVQTRVFDRVLIDSSALDGVGPDAVDGATAVTLDLLEAPRYTIGYGLRWESSEGLGAAVDAVDRNAFGRGVSIGVRALWADEEQALRLYSEIPRIFDTPIDLSLFAETFEEEETALVSEGYELAGQLSFPLGESVEGRIYGRYRDAKDTDFGLATPLETTVRSPLLGAQILVDRRDDPLDPHRGFFASLDVSGSRELLGAENEYLRSFGRFEYFLSPSHRFDGRVTWAQGVRAGVAEVRAGDLPLDVRFFAGGQYSVRGYDSRSLGERIELADGALRPLGGEASLVLNQELRVRVVGGYWAVLFYDLGNVWQDVDDFGDDLFAGAGIGLRAHTPIGLIRLDFATPLDARPDDDDLQISFGFGQAF
ncbi:MAG: translocation/assembly module TamB domain-containing protein [Acidobacteriota bacterium]